jgi:hypothetical protein
VRIVIADLKSGALVWSGEWLEEVSQRFAPPSDTGSPRRLQSAAKKETKA